VVAGPAHPHPNPPPSRGREKKGCFRKNLPQKAIPLSLARERDRVRVVAGVLPPFTPTLFPTVYKGRFFEKEVIDVPPYGIL
jgi:hypothetical protein